jgi:DNA-binding transcriptional MerR regulator
MKIGEASRVSGVSARSLRHYEDEGLIIPGRCSNGFRDYCQLTIDRVLVTRPLLESGLPLRLIRQVLPSPRDDHDARTNAVNSEFLHEVQRYRNRLAERVIVLTNQQKALDGYLMAALSTDL